MAGFISAATIDQVRAASDIVDVIGAIVPLKKAGANFTALCPFHKEKSPSFNVNPRLQIFRCFGCGKGGNVFGFLMEHEHLTFPEAVVRLAERARIPLQYEGGAAPSGTAKALKDVLFDIHEKMAQRWQTALVSDPAAEIARDYLSKRGVSEEGIKLFRLGYSPDLWDDTVNWAKSKNFDLETVETAGLLIKRDQGDGWYGRFRGRLMFPICDEQGRIAGFSGRMLAGDEKTAKYVNSPETPIFTKGRIMFGLDKAKRALGEKGFAIVCEGQLDLIACFMAGHQNVVAPQGTAFTGEHARILKRYVDEVVLCFDSDKAGRSATVRALDDLLASGLAIRVATLPAPHDPDSFIKQNGSEAFGQLIGSARGFFDFLLDYVCSENDPTNDKGKLAIVRAMAEASAKTGSPVLLDDCAQKTAMRLAVSADAVRLEFRKIRRAAANKSSDRQIQEAEAPEDNATTQERWLIRLVFSNDEAFNWANAHFHVTWLASQTVRHILETAFQMATSRTWNGVPALIEKIQGAASLSLLTETLADSRDITDPLKQLQDLSRTFRDRMLEAEINRLRTQLNDPALDEAGKMERHGRMVELRRQRQAPIESPLNTEADA